MKDNGNGNSGVAALWREFGLKMGVSVLLFGVLFGVLYGVEFLFPALQGTLLQWDNAAFCVGIPASVVGVGYVLTIKNPQNYTGFYGGIVMSALLATQFFLQGNYDLVVLQLGVFAPFMTKSILSWKKAGSSATQAEKFVPQYLHGWAAAGTYIVALLIIVADYALCTIVLQHNAWGENVLLKLCSGVMIASSTLANYWLIYRKIDAWIWWVLYGLSGMAFYVLLGNVFSFVLFTVFLLVNGSALVAWVRIHNAAKEENE